MNNIEEGFRIVKEKIVNFDFTKIFRGDKVIWMIFLLLCLISIVEVYSASSMLTFRTNFWEPISKHILFLFAGTIVVLICHGIHPKFFRLFFIALPFIWILLIVTQIYGITVNDANRNFFGIQASEFAKLFLIASVAFILSRQKNKISESLSFTLICILSVITCTLIFMDNFSTAAMLFAVIVIMMFIGQVSLKRIGMLILTTVAILALMFTFIWFFPATSRNIGLKRAVVGLERLKDYKGKNDIKSGEYKITDDNFQATQAKIAVARGKIFGKAPGNGQQRDFLPQAYSDFIYAIIIEETGIVGGIVVLLLYVFLFIRAGTIAGRCPKLFPKFLVIGCALMIVTQALINMAVSVGLFPITGQPLPLISRGGNSIITTCIFIGILLSVSRFENPIGIMREEEIAKEFEEEKRLFEEAEQLELQGAY